MKLTQNIGVITFAVVTSLCGRGVQAEDGGLIATDKEIKIGVPVQLQHSLPLQLESSLSTQYSLAPSSEGTFRLGNVVLEQGLRYPPLFGDVYLGNSIGEHLTPSVKDGIPKGRFNSAYLTSWLNKQWASVNLSLTHTHLIEKPEEQLTYGVYKAFSALNSKLYFSVGEYLFNDLGNGYWYRTTDLSMAYGWKVWNLSVFVQQQGDSRLREQSVWAAIKKNF